MLLYVLQVLRPVTFESKINICERENRREQEFTLVVLFRSNLADSQFC